MIGKWTSSSLLALLLGGLALTGAAAVVPAPTQQHASYRKTADGVFLPDPHATPGAVDQNVNQANIQSTICLPGYTKTVRPPVSVTNRLKQELMGLYRTKGRPQDNELDHLISLELGGCPACRTNLWPEPYLPAPGAREKDQLENALHKAVCAGTMTLAEAQQKIAENWWVAYRELGLGPRVASASLGQARNRAVAHAAARRPPRQLGGSPQIRVFRFRSDPRYYEAVDRVRGLDTAHRGHPTVDAAL